MQLGFCGLGQMGAPMAARLLAAGHRLTVWNRTPSKVDPLVRLGATAAASPLEAAAGTEAVFTMLADPEALDDVLFGTDGVAGTAAPTTVIEMSTVGPGTIQDARERLPDHIGLVDAPVFGTVPEATDGTLTLYVGAGDDDFARWQPVLAVFGDARHVGRLGDGAAMKLVLNATLKVLAAELGEAMALGDAYGLDEQVVMDVLLDTPIGRTVARCRPSIESGRWPTTFKLVLAEKDLRLVDEAGRDKGLDSPIAEAARSWYQRAEKAGIGGLNYTAIVSHVRGKDARP
jgi:3-hydroxyisobutyrate dehydrogenase-like beta-hydroxyacid dehydrogenase